MQDLTATRTFQALHIVEEDIRALCAENKSLREQNADLSASLAGYKEKNTTMTDTLNEQDKEIRHLRNDNPTTVALLEVNIESRNEVVRLLGRHIEYLDKFYIDQHQRDMRGLAERDEELNRMSIQMLSLQQQVAVANRRIQDLEGTLSSGSQQDTTPQSSPLPSDFNSSVGTLFGIDEDQDLNKRKISEPEISTFPDSSANPSTPSTTHNEAAVASTTYSLHHVLGSSLRCSPNLPRRAAFQGSSALDPYQFPKSAEGPPDVSG